MTKAHSIFFFFFLQKSLTKIQTKTDNIKAIQILLLYYTIAFSINTKTTLFWTALISFIMYHTSRPRTAHRLFADHLEA